MRRVTCAAIALACAAVVCADETVGDARPFPLKETPLATLPDDQALPWVSPDHEHVLMIHIRPTTRYPGNFHALFHTPRYYAWLRRVRQGAAKYRVVTRGWGYDFRSPEYDGVSEPHFDSSGTRFAFVAVRDIEFRAVIDGVEGPPYRMVGSQGVVFSPDGERFAYAAVRDDKWWFIVDGEEHGPYEEAFLISFDPEGDRFAYGATIDGRHRVIYSDSGGREGPVCTVYSGNGQRVTHVWMDEDSRYSVELDGERSPWYETITVPRFSPDGRRVGYAAKQGRKWFAVVDGHEGPRYREVYETPSFSADGSTVAYAARKGSRDVIVVDGEEVAEYRQVGQPTLNTDGSHVAFAAQQEGQWRLIVDGLVVREFEIVPPGGEFVFVGPALLRGTFVEGNQVIRLEVDLSASGNRQPRRD